MNKDSYIGQIATIMLNFRDNLKIYHWQTKSYARHKASCELIDSLDDKTDKFIEVMQGSRNKRLNISVEYQSFNKIENQTEESGIILLESFKKWVSNVLPRYILENEKELLNIKDEILADIDKTIYLFTFK